MKFVTDKILHTANRATAGERVILHVKQIGQGCLFAEWGVCCEQVLKMKHYGNIVTVHKRYGRVQTDKHTAFSFISVKTSESMNDIEGFSKTNAGCPA